MIPEFEGQLDQHNDAPLGVLKCLVKEYQDILPENLVDAYHDLAQYAALNGWEDWSSEIYELNAFTVQLAAHFSCLLQATGVYENEQDVQNNSDYMEMLRHIFRKEKKDDAQNFLKGLILPHHADSRFTAPTMDEDGKLQPFKVPRQKGWDLHREYDIFDNNFFPEAYGKYFRLLYIRTMSRADHPQRAIVEQQIKYTTEYIGTAPLKEKYATNWHEDIMSAEAEMKIENEDFAKQIFLGSMRA